MASNTNTTEASEEPAFGFTLTESIADESHEDDDEIAQDLAKALEHYRRGHHRAAMAAGADALNAIANDYGIQGGAWT